MRRFFETADEAAGRAIVEEYDVRWVIVEKRRPLRFAMPRWLVETAESETSILYEVN